MRRHCQNLIKIHLEDDDVETEQKLLNFRELTIDFYTRLFYIDTIDRMTRLWSLIKNICLEEDKSITG